MIIMKYYVLWLGYERRYKIEDTPGDILYLVSRISYLSRQLIKGEMHK